jgi:hypothetical protein
MHKLDAHQSRCCGNLLPEAELGRVGKKFLRTLMRYVSAVETK